MEQLKPIPSFANEDEEREFWESHDSAEFIDWNQAVSMTFPNLKPSTKTISIRLPESLIDSQKFSLTNKMSAIRLLSKCC
jgi:predicted DNA binding CopG/RHH family protein